MFFHIIDFQKIIISFCRFRAERASIFGSGPNDDFSFGFSCYWHLHAHSIVIFRYFIDKTFLNCLPTVVEFSDNYEKRKMLGNAMFFYFCLMFLYFSTILFFLFSKQAKINDFEFSSFSDFLLVRCRQFSLPGLYRIRPIFYHFEPM